MIEIPSSGLSLQRIKDQDLESGSRIRIKNQDQDQSRSRLLPYIFSLFHINRPESSGMKARHASKSKKAKEGDDPSNSKTEKGDVVRVPIGEKVDVQEVPGTAEAGEQRLLRVEGREDGHQAIVTMVLKRVKRRQRKCRSRLSGGSVLLKDVGGDMGWL